MTIFQLVDKDNTMLKIPLSGVSEDCDRKELKENLVEIGDKVKNKIKKKE